MQGMTWTMDHHCRVRCRIQRPMTLLSMTDIPESSKFKAAIQAMRLFTEGEVNVDGQGSDAAIGGLIGRISFLILVLLQKVGRRPIGGDIHWDIQRYSPELFNCAGCTLSVDDKKKVTSESLKWT